MSDSNDWLKTQTKAQLQKLPPDKLAPAVVAGYSLVLLERGPDRERVLATLRNVAGHNRGFAASCPLVVRRNLSLTDAMVAQFELICADSIAVFVNDDVVRLAKQSYLNKLFKDVRGSAEFAPVIIHLTSIPDDVDGQRFLRQFFGPGIGVPTTHTVARKKARVMREWAARLRVTIEIDGVID